jgi:hypothetical protein
VRDEDDPLAGLRIRHRLPLRDVGHTPVGIR